MDSERLFMRREKQYYIDINTLPDRLQLKSSLVKQYERLKTERVNFVAAKEGIPKRKISTRRPTLTLNSDSDNKFVAVRMQHDKSELFQMYLRAGMKEDIDIALGTPELDFLHSKIFIDLNLKELKQDISKHQKSNHNSIFGAMSSFKRKDYHYRILNNSDTG